MELLGQDLFKKRKNFVRAGLKSAKIEASHSTLRRLKLGELLQKEMSLNDYLTQVEEALHTKGHPNDYYQQALINIERNLNNPNVNDDAYELILSYKRRLIFKLYTGTKGRPTLAY